LEADQSANNEPRRSLNSHSTGKAYREIL